MPGIYVFESMTGFFKLFIICSFNVYYLMYILKDIHVYYFIYITTNIFNNLVTYSKNVSGLYISVSCLVWFHLSKGKS